MQVSDINLVVADVARSMAFYRLLGLEFRSTDSPDTFGPCITTGPGPSISLHSAEFARWWDPTHPGVVAGGTEVDLFCDDGAGALDDLVARLHAHGVEVVKEPEDMPWGERFAIVLDPDGHRIGLKSAPAAG